MVSTRCYTRPVPPNPWTPSIPPPARRSAPMCALAAEEVFRAAGFPEGTFSTLLIGSGAAEALVDHPAIRAVTLTGSEGAGSALARRAGQALKKCVLELGGSDPFVVLVDADLEKVSAAAVAGRLVNNG